MHAFTKTLTVTICLGMAVGLAATQEKTAHKAAAKKAEVSDAQYTKQVLSAAPQAIAKEAGVIRIDKDGKMNTIRESKNGFNCMMALGSPMCADANSMEFFGAWMKHENPPDKLGLTYMLAGDKGASNTDPAATGKTADNHWVVTGPHLMILGPGAKSFGFSDSADADPTKPYMMWAGTPYEHAMIPVSSSKAMSGSAKMKAPAKEEKK